ncbi:hypothetical protein EW146_g8663 [Bondarzewia mesenterica]|uniref:Reverse transcriptase Ty1/copia-type domain-containing protein n=1 Tax=Bondarzewia mesenterica TaxID=1095465 RepID=A0A4S4LCM9_9AGAM|nr:hypothetical protein EW146_g8663 [Bondarzewia mesenterica]
MRPGLASNPTYLTHENLAAEPLFSFKAPTTPKSIAVLSSASLLDFTYDSPTSSSPSVLPTVSHPSLHSLNDDPSSFTSSLPSNPILPSPVQSPPAPTLPTLLSDITPPSPRQSHHIRQPSAKLAESLELPITSQVAQAVTDSKTAADRLHLARLHVATSPSLDNSLSNSPSFSSLYLLSPLSPSPSDTDLILAAAAQLNEEPCTWTDVQALPMLKNGALLILMNLPPSCLLLHLAAHFSWPIKQLDIKTAFLHGDLEEDLWMEQPDGFAEPGKESWCLLTIHVDDLNVARSSSAVIQDVKISLRSRFDIVELGPVQWLVGLSISCNLADHTITVSQTGLIDSVIDKFHLLNANTVSTPLNCNVRLTHDDSPTTSVDKSTISSIPFRELIGCLMYLSIRSRPDISFTVQHLTTRTPASEATPDPLDFDDQSLATVFHLDLA